MKFFWLSLLYFIVRLTFLTSIPIFNDEAIHLDWGWIELHREGGTFHSLYAGRPPLLLWVIGIFETVLPDPLIAGRLVSIIAGFFSLWGLYLIGKKFFNNTLAQLTVLLYIITPLFSFFDRQVLMESVISAVGIWSCYLLLRLYQEQRGIYAVFLGIILGIGFFIKQSTIIFILTYLLLYVFAFILQKRNWRKMLENMFFTVFAFGATNYLLFIQPLFWQTLSSLAAERSLTLQELLQFPFSVWMKNIQDVVELGFWHLTPLVFLLGLLGVMAIFFSKETEKKIVVLWFLVSMALVILLARALTPRYVVSYLPFMLIFSSYIIVGLWKKERHVGFVLATVTIGISLGVTFVQIIYPRDYFSALQRMTKFSQKDEYVAHWPSGYGIDEVRQFLLEQSKDEPIYAGVRQDAGNPENAVFAYFNPSERVIPFYFDVKTVRATIQNFDCFVADRPVYFISRDDRMAGLDNFLIEIKRVYKPEGKSFIGIHTLKTPCEGKLLELDGKILGIRTQ